MPLASELVHLREIVLGETGGSDDYVGAMPERGQDVVLGTIRSGVSTKTSQEFASASAAEA
jgi:hypothetical protein